MPMSPEAAHLDQIFDGLLAEPDRDQYGRPLLVPGGEHAMPLQCRRPRSDGKLPYTRASSLSNYVSDHTALETWRMRSLTKGLGEREDLAALAAALPPIISNTRDKAGMTKAERAGDDITNAALDEIAEEAMRHANRDYKASWGTAIHSFTDPGEHGQVPARMAADVDAWFSAVGGFVIHATEVFVANDELQAAGTFDHLVEIPWRPDLGVMVLDKKTGLLHPDQHAVQLAVYAGGTPYDVQTDTRTEWTAQPSRTHGVIAHIPLGLGRADFYLVDLEKGQRGALLATQVRAYRSDRELMERADFVQEQRLHVASLLAIANSREELNAIATAHVAVWTDDLTALGRQRLAALAA